MTLDRPTFMTSQAQSAASAPTQDAWEGFPNPRTSAPSISRDDALALIAARSPELLVVDVRRTDYEGGAVAGSINLPAHSFYLNRGVFYDLCKRAGVKQVAFYCGKSGSGAGMSCFSRWRDYNTI